MAVSGKGGVRKAWSVAVMGLAVRWVCPNCRASQRHRAGGSFGQPQFAARASAMARVKAVSVVMPRIVLGLFMVRM